MRNDRKNNRMSWKIHNMVAVRPFRIMVTTLFKDVTICHKTFPQFPYMNICRYSRVKKITKNRLMIFHLLITLGNLLQSPKNKELLFCDDYRKSKKLISLRCSYDLFNKHYLKV